MPAGPGRASIARDVIDESTPADGATLHQRLDPALLYDQGLEGEAMRASVRQRLFGGPPAAFHIDRFVVTKRLGAGGMGVVYLAEDPVLGRKVAIKLLHAEGARNATAQARLQREARALASLSHPNVVVVHEVGMHEGQLYLVMEHVAGQTMRAWTRAHADDWRSIVAQYRAAGEGVAAAHRAGIIHRDFKPDNVLVDEDGRSRVLDFGLAASGAEPGTTGEAEASWEELDGADLTKTGTILGTPSYMAPEQFRGMPVDARTDQFSFCVALWEALFEQRPFEGDSLVTLRRAVIAGRRREPPSRTRVPRSIVAALARGLAPDPADRFGSMPELLQALAKVRPPHRRVWPWLGLVPLGLAGAVLAERAGSPDPSPTSPPIVSAEPTLAEPAVVASSSEPEPELPTLSRRRLTHTSSLGVLHTCLDPSKQNVLYGTSSGDVWVFPLSGGEARPITLPLSPIVTALCGPDGSYWLLGDGAIRRAHADGRIEHVARLPSTFASRGWVSPDGMTLALPDGTGFVLWDMSRPDDEPLRFETDGGISSVAWSPDAGSIAARTKSWRLGEDRIDVFDFDGSLRSSTTFPLPEPNGSGSKMMWLPSGLVMLAADDTQTWVQCLRVTDAGLVPGPRSADLGTLPLTKLVDVTAKGTLILEWAEAQDEVLVFDLTTEGARPSRPPFSVAHRSVVAWRSEDELAFLAAAPRRALVEVRVDGRHEPELLMEGPVQWIADDGAGGVVVVTADGKTVQHLARGASTPRPVRLPEVMGDTPVMRCRSPRDCILASSDAPAVFFSVDLEREQVRRRFACPVRHGCDQGGWGWSHDGKELVLVLSPRQVSRFDAETGEALGAYPLAPEWVRVQSVTQTSRGELVLTGMLEGMPPDGRYLEEYRLLRMTDGGTVQSLWGSEQTWMVRPTASPSGDRVAVAGRTFHVELMELELGSLCDEPP